MRARACAIRSEPMHQGILEPSRDIHVHRRRAVMDMYIAAAPIEQATRSDRGTKLDR
jgi:hypothetical protein